MFKKDYEVSILVNGKKVQEYIKDGKIYIEGRKDTTYSIKIKNNSYGRMVAIPTVDGLSVIDGKEASYNSTGYIVPGNDSVTIDGWRKNDNEVAQFYFSSSNKSYAARMNKGKNQGVIGVAVYKEKEKEVVVEKTTYIIDRYPSPIRTYPPVYPSQLWYFDYPQVYPSNTNPTWLNSGISQDTSCLSGGSFSCSSLAMNNEEDKCASQQKIGTGWGETKKSEIVNVSFERDNSSLTVFEFYYNTRSELIKKGIDFKKKLVAIEEPKAFPNQYCMEPID